MDAILNHGVGCTCDKQVSHSNCNGKTSKWVTSDLSRLSVIVMSAWYDITFLYPDIHRAHRECFVDSVAQENGKISFPPTVSDVIIFPMESATMPEAWGPKEILHLDFLVVFLVDVI